MLHLRTFYKLLSLFLLLAFAARVLHAQAVGGELPQGTKLDIMILMDSSGSMLVTDPQRLRDRGVELFVERLSSDDRVGVVKFAEDAKVVLPLNTSSANLPKIIQAELARVESTGTYTNLYAGIEVAAKQLLSSVRDDATPILVLLSDGKMEPPPQFGEAQAISKKLLEDLLPDLDAKNIRIYTLSFSDQADRDLLSKIAKATDAASWYSPSVERLQKSFEDLLLVLKKATPTPSQSKGLLVEHDVEEVTFYLARNPSQSLTLISPIGESYKFDAKPESVRWYRGEDFDVISVSSPSVGTWNVEGYGSDDGYAAVLTDLDIDVRLPPIVRADSPFDILIGLKSRDKEISLPKMLGLVTYEYEISPTDKVSEPFIRKTLSAQSDAKDVGNREQVTKQSVTLEGLGEYSISVKAVGPTFRREKSISFIVKPTLITLTGVSRRELSASAKAHHHAVDNSSNGHAEGGEKPHAEANYVHGEQQDEVGHEQHNLGNLDNLGDHEESHASDIGGFNISLHPDALKYKDLSVKVAIVDSRGKRRELKAERVLSDPKHYRLDLMKDLVEDGDYSGVAVLRGMTFKGEEIESESPPVKFSFTREKVAQQILKDGVVGHQEEHGHDEYGHEEHGHGEHGGVEGNNSQHHSPATLPVLPIVLAIGAADLLGLLIAIKLMGKNKSDLSGDQAQSHQDGGEEIVEGDDASHQSELDELKAFADRLDKKVHSSDIDPLDSSYDDIVMRVEERLAAEDLEGLSNSYQDEQAQVE